MSQEDITGPMTQVWDNVAGAAPSLIAALVILIIGLIASSFFAGLTRKFLKTLKVDGMMLQFPPARKAEESGWNVKPSYLLSKFVKWFFIIVTLIAVSNQLGLNEVSEMLNQAIAYLPKFVAALVILAIGFVLGRFVNDLVLQSMKSSQFGPQATTVVPLVAKYAVIVFAVLTAATQLNIGAEMIQIFFTAIVGAMALALGLAFGLGGKDHASKLLDELYKK